jgi:hypothetical protein
MKLDLMNYWVDHSSQGESMSGGGPSLMEFLGFTMDPQVPTKQVSCWEKGHSLIFRLGNIGGMCG